MTARILTPASPNWDELPLETDPLTYKDVIERLTKLVDRTFARARDEVGQALLEFAIVTPIFLLLMFGALDVELALADLGSVRFIAQQAAICETRAAQGCN